MVCSNVVLVAFRLFYYCLVTVNVKKWNNEYDFRKCEVAECSFVMKCLVIKFILAPNWISIYFKWMDLCSITPVIQEV